MGKKKVAKSIVDCLLRKKMVNCFLGFNDSYASKICRDNNATYSHFLKLIHIFIEEKIIVLSVHKRKKIYAYTEKGKEVKRCLEKIITKLNS